MKKLNFLLLAGFFLALSSSCRIQSRVIGEKNQKSPEINVNTPDVLIRPMVADLDISQEKKESIYEADLNLNMSEIKQNAQAKFMEEHGCDVIINPVYRKITTLENSNVSKINYEVTGFPATIIKIKQTDTLSRSVYNYNQMAFDIKRDEFIYKDIDDIKGSELFLSLGSGNYSGIEIGYFPYISDGIWYYGSVENYNTDDNTIDLTANFNDVFEIPNNNLPFSMTSFSLGSGYRANLNKRISSNIFGGVNYSMLTLENAFRNQNNPGGDYILSGVNTLGIRAGIGIDYVLFRNLQVFAKGFSNINLYNMSDDVITDGDDVNSTFNLDNLPRLNYAVGCKFRF